MINSYQHLQLDSQIETHIERNGQVSGQLSIAASPANGQVDVRKVMHHHRSNVSLGGPRSRQRGGKSSLNTRQRRPITSNQRGLSVGNATRQMLLHGKQGAGRITEKQLAHLQRTASVVTDSTAVGGAMSGSNMKNSSAERLQGQKIHRRMGKEPRVTMMLSSTAVAQCTSQGNIINQLSCQPSVQVDYKNGRITAKQQSYPEIAIASGVLQGTQTGPQSIISTKKAYNLKNQTIRTKRPIQSAHNQGRIRVHNSPSSATHFKTAKQMGFHQQTSNFDLPVQSSSGGDPGQQQQHQQQMSMSQLQNVAFSSSAGSIGSAEKIKQHSKVMQSTVMNSSAATMPARGSAVTGYTSGTTTYNMPKERFAKNNIYSPPVELVGEPYNASTNATVTIQQMHTTVSCLASPDVISPQNPTANAMQKSAALLSSNLVNKINNEVIKEEERVDGSYSDSRSHQASVSHEETSKNRNEIYVRSAAIANGGDNSLCHEINTINHLVGTTPLDNLVAMQQAAYPRTNSPSECVSITDFDEKRQDTYMDNEDYNTSAVQREKLHSLLKQNVETLNRKRKSKHLIDFDSTAAFNEFEEQQMQEGASRLVSNIDSALRKNRRTSHGFYTQPQMQLQVAKQRSRTPNSLHFERFAINDKLAEIENRQKINTKYYDPDNTNFDIRRNHQNKNSKGKLNSQFLQSAFWNPQTHMIVSAQSKDLRPYINLNTHSFAKKFTRKAPRHRVRQIYKYDGDKPHPGYYDTAVAFEKTFGQSVSDCVNMKKAVPRKDIFTQKIVVSSTDTKPLGNKWQNEEIPQAFMDFRQYMSRKEQTVAMGHNQLKWMHKKSADEIARAKLKAAKDAHVREMENEELARTGVIKEEHIDWSNENNLSPFTFDVMKMGEYLKIYQIGQDKVDNEVTGLKEAAQAKNTRDKAEEARKDRAKQQTNLYQK